MINISLVFGILEIVVNFIQITYTVYVDFDRNFKVVS